MSKTTDTFPDLDTPTIIPATGIKCPKTDMEMTYLKKTIDKAIHQKLRNKDVYKIDMQKIYDLIVGQKH